MIMDAVIGKDLNYEKNNFNIIFDWRAVSFM